MTCNTSLAALLSFKGCITLYFFIHVLYCQVQSPTDKCYPRISHDQERGLRSETSLSQRWPVPASSSPQQPYEVIIHNQNAIHPSRNMHCCLAKYITGCKICADFFGNHNLKIQCIEHSTQTQNNLLKL